MSLQTKTRFADYFLNEESDSSRLFEYLISLPQAEYLQVMKIPEDFEQYVKYNVFKVDRKLADKAFGNLDNCLFELNSLLQEESVYCTSEYEYGSHGNIYISDWHSTARYRELAYKADFLKKLADLDIWYED